tara:strand:+ start:122 stop:286 length:165 start_codon:yes stop_codon:yes gene_type:complete
VSSLLSRLSPSWTAFGRETGLKTTDNNTLVLLLNQWNEAGWLAERTQWDMDTSI